MKMAWLHGWAANGHVFDSFLRSLDKEFESRLQGISPFQFVTDLPGHGEKSYDGVFDLDKVADSLAEEIGEHFKSVGSPHDDGIWLGGWSLGGHLAMKIAIKGELPIKGLILFSTFSRYAWAEDCPEGREPEKITAFSDYFEIDFEKKMRGFWDLQVMYSPDAKPIIEEIVPRLVEGGPPKALKDAQATLVKSDIRQGLAKLEIPALVIAGNKDRTTSPEMNKRVAELIKNSEYHELAKSSHAPFVSDEKTCVDLVVDFVLSHGGSAYA